MPTIYIDNKPYEIREGLNLLHACLSLGFDLPYFCWHPAIHSVGACRMCAIKLFKDENDTQGKIVMSCMTPANNGTRISIDDPEAVKFRKSVIEWLMENHPHDCPVCDEGGECHLQDMTLLSGHVYRRFRFKKRTHRNQNLGPFINHEMNRCIQCYRCVRFYCDYAGGRDFGVFSWHNSVYFGRHEDGTLQSEFSGNLVEVCPTGVFTDKTLLRHYTRKWDLQTAPSVCVHCSIGCNTIPGERYGMLRRIRNRFNREVNGYFICDRGRFGYEFVNSDLRVRQPLRQKPGEKSEAVSREAIVREIGDSLGDRNRVIGIGSPRASLESNFALRTLVGPEHFYVGAPETETQLISSIVSVLRGGPIRSASFHDVELADTVLVLGEDVPNVAPMLGLALRQSVLRKPMAIAKELHIEEWNDASIREALQQEKGPLFIATPDATRLDDIATATYRAAPDDIARLGFAVAHELNSKSPPVPDVCDDELSLAQRIADALRESERPLIISGTTCGSQAMIKASANIAYALHSMNRAPQLHFTLSCCNSLGLGLMGGDSIAAALKVLENDTVDTVIILESDIYRHTDVEIATKLLGSAKNVVVIDCLANKTTASSHFVLPAATFAEADGTFVSNEGRAQRFYKVFIPQDEIRESWQWIREMMLASGQPGAQRWQNFDDIVADLARSLPIFNAITEITPSASFRVAGQKIPRQPHRYSGRTAMHANIDVHEPKPPDDTDTPLSFSMEGYEGRPPSPLIAHYWAPHWNSVQSVNKYQVEVNGPLFGGDPGKRLIEPVGSARPAYFSEIPAAFHPQNGEVLIVAAYHVFGSEELSAHAPGIAELSPVPYVALNPQDAEKSALKDGDTVEVTLSNVAYKLSVKTRASLPVGVAAVSAGLPGLRWDGIPVWRRLNPERTPQDVGSR